MNILQQIKDYSVRQGKTIAVSSANQVLTYAELEEASGKLACYLSQRFGENKDPVVVYGHKSPLMLVCFLACVKSGRAYCPVDVSVPQSRVQLIVETVNPSAVLAVEPLEPDWSCKLNAGEIRQAIEQTPAPIGEEHQLQAEDVFYIIFTSGSTGTPKGVQITLDCLNHYLDWAVTLGGSPEEKRGKVFLNQAPFSFDLSVMDLYTCLASGGTLWTLDKAVQADYRSLYDSLNRSGAAVWVSTPSFADICLSDPCFGEGLLPKLEIFLFCGETLTNSTAQRLQQRFPKARIVNTYGPTESTVAMTQVLVTPECCQQKAPLPVGEVKPGTWVEIRKEDGTLADDGERGEIVIIGDTVSTGYFRQAGLTEKVFFQCEKEGRTYRGYRTGDEGYLLDGMLYYCGRIDLQIKLHGYRIEVEDIEQNLMKLPQIHHAVVIPKLKDGRVKSLAAFICCGKRVEKAFELSQQLKGQLREYLPDYMIPKKFIFLEQIPMTPNGKADRKYLGGLLA